MYIAGVNDGPGLEFGTEDEAKAFITRHVTSIVIRKRVEAGRGHQAAVQAGATFEDGNLPWQINRDEQPAWEHVVFSIWEFNSLAGTWMLPNGDRVWVRDASAYIVPPDEEFVEILESAGWTQLRPGH